jgi:hypothetical protein
MSIGAKHWYWDLENTETDERLGRSESRLDVKDLDKGSCLLREDAVLEGTREFLKKTTQGVEGHLFIAHRGAVVHGITIAESWQED